MKLCSLLNTKPLERRAEKERMSRKNNGKSEYYAAKQTFELRFDYCFIANFVPSN